jgi:hypothetical protein
MLNIDKEIDRTDHSVDDDDDDTIEPMEMLERQRRPRLRQDMIIPKRQGV